jgi:cytochrome c556
MIAKTALILASFPLTHLAVAAESDQSKLRHNYMEAVGGNMGTIGSMMKLGIKNPDQIAAHAQAIKNVAPYLLDVFKDGKAEGASKAEIWKSWDDFKKKSEDFQKAADEFAAAAATKDMAATGKAMGALGETCKSCHKLYKVKD